MISAPEKRGQMYRTGVKIIYYKTLPIQLLYCRQGLCLFREKSDHGDQENADCSGRSLMDLESEREIIERNEQKLLLVRQTKPKAPSWRI